MPEDKSIFEFEANDYFSDVDNMRTIDYEPSRSGGYKPKKKTKGKVRTIDYEPSRSGGYKPKKKTKGKAIGHLLLAPINWVSNSAKWITNPTSKGGGQYVMKGLAIACLLLTTESVYQWYAGEDSVKFLPKPGINDGANISRVIPLGDAGNAVINTLTGAANLAGANIEAPFQFQKTDLLIWADQRFYLALVTALGLNVIEAIVLRKVNLQTRINQLNNSKKRDTKVSSAVRSFDDMAQDYQSLETQVRKSQVLSYGNGRIIFLCVILAACYGIEGSSFFATAAPGTPFLLNMILAVASIFGAEGFWVLAEYMEERETEDEPTK